MSGADKLKPDDVILVNSTKKTHVLYAGQIKQIYAAEDDDETPFDVQFLRGKTPKNRSRGQDIHFLVPCSNWQAGVLYEDIIGRLLKPLVHGGTARVARHLIFPVDFDCHAK